MPGRVRLVGALLAFCFAAASGAAPAAAGEPCGPGPNCTGESETAKDNSRLALVLVRTTFVSFGQAIETGNYSMLRDLASPGFRKRYSEAGLEQALAPLREAALQFGDAVLVVPRINAFERKGEGLIEIAGVWPSSPRASRYRLVFQAGSGAWQLFGFEVSAADDGEHAKAPR